MKGRPNSSREKAEEWRRYYESHPELTGPDVANHFGINIHTMNAAWRRYGLRGADRKSSTVDPFGAATKTIRSAVYQALTHEDRLSPAEYDQLQSILDIVGKRQSHK